MRGLLVSIFICFTAFVSQAQTVVYGTVFGQSGEPLPYAAVVNLKTKKGVSASANGLYYVTIPDTGVTNLQFSFTSYFVLKKEVSPTSDSILLNVNLKPKELQSVDVFSTQRKAGEPMQTINSKVAAYVPTASGDFINSVVASQMGVASNNELSASYSVRGGSYDENLIYINDIQVYRPFLARAGQQEGLSFINGEMVNAVEFSPGGFEAKYGDKMSSVLDIKYKKPQEQEITVTGGFLGGSLTYGNSFFGKKLSLISGVRYRNNAYILSSLNDQGSYKPRFVDWQTYLTYKLSDKWELGALANYSSNLFQFVPQTRETEFGSIQQKIRFTVFFDGQEITSYNTQLGALDLSYRPSDFVTLKMITSAYRTRERERFDIVGQYFLDEIDRDFGSDDFGDVLRNLGVGGFLNHARNEFSADVASVQFKGYANVVNHYLQFGVGAQHENISDVLSEWVYIDSADFSLPQNPADNIVFDNVIRAKNTLQSQRYTGYVQDEISYLIGKETELKLNGGVRANYWTYSNQLLISPRARAVIKPHWKRRIDSVTTVTRDVGFSLSGGAYHQPPFYRELRGLDGVINPAVRAQKSYHLVAGMDYGLFLWNRPFQLTTEVYYKWLFDLIPYELENIRLRYYAENSARGYAKGIDLKLNGEFVKGIESWFTISVSQTQEDLQNDSYTEFYNAEGTTIKPSTFDKVAVDSATFYPGYIPRPTDQRVTFGMFFQDEMPRFPGFKIQLNLLFGTALPYGPPSYDRYQDTLRSAAYRRLDLGFSYDLITKDKPAKGFFKGVKEAFVSLEAFNLLQINNIVNYTWVSDVNGTRYPVPNYLTNRRINLKLILRL